VRGKRKQRLRRASKVLNLGDQIELNYNPEILNQDVPEPRLVHDAQDYSVWFKPYGLNCQGSRWGDFASIERWVETHSSELFGSERSVFLVHRLDRATTGLILLCHTKNAARLFSEMFREGKIDKRYQAIVQGDFSNLASTYEADEPIDGKAAKSVFSFSAKSEGHSLLDVSLFTGRKHQIRKHLSGLGFPIVGDRLYGEVSDKNLQLQSIALSFECPITCQKQYFSVSEQDRLSL
jgi:tRNA pseudouridine32 synthase/23S rRNA pseudouridine746 synthase